MCPSVRRSVRPSVGRSVRHTRVEFPRYGPNSNKIASGIRKYAIWKTNQRQVRGQLARTHLLSELCSTCFCVFSVLYHSVCVCGGEVRFPFRSHRKHRNDRFIAKAMDGLMVSVWARISSEGCLYCIAQFTSCSTMHCMAECRA